MDISDPEKVSETFCDLVTSVVSGTCTCELPNSERVKYSCSG